VAEQDGCVLIDQIEDPGQRLFANAVIRQVQADLAQRPDQEPFRETNPQSGERAHPDQCAQDRAQRRSHTLCLAGLVEQFALLVGQLAVDSSGAAFGDAVQPLPGQRLGHGPLLGSQLDVLVALLVRRAEQVAVEGHSDRQGVAPQASARAP